MKDIRSAIGLTQEQFAAKVGVTFSSLDPWENGRRAPSLLAMWRIQELREDLRENE